MIYNVIIVLKLMTKSNALQLILMEIMDTFLPHGIWFFLPNENKTCMA